MRRGVECGSVVSGPAVLYRAVSCTPISGDSQVMAWRALLCRPPTGPWFSTKYQRKPRTGCCWGRQRRKQGAGEERAPASRPWKHHQRAALPVDGVTRRLLQCCLQRLCRQPHGKLRGQTEGSERRRGCSGCSCGWVVYAQAQARTVPCQALRRPTRACLPACLTHPRQSRTSAAAWPARQPWCPRGSERRRVPAAECQAEARRAAAAANGEVGGAGGS
jgi:hypothetical protein